jgi:hypothetical protein
LYKRDPDSEASSARSRTGYIIKLGTCPLVWKSQLQTEISLSTLEAEYAALSYALKTLLPLKRLLQGVADTLGLEGSLQATIHAEVFEDNMGALFLATNQRLSNRTKYFHVKTHWFWDHYKNKDFDISHCETHRQDADYLTKGLAREPFCRNRFRAQGW